MSDTHVDFSRIFFADVDGGEVTVQIWSDNSAGFARECTARDIELALRKILEGKAVEKPGGRQP
jgi:hypothetical protein